MLTVEPHPLLDLGAFITRLPDDVSRMAISDEICALLKPGATASLTTVGSPASLTPATAARPAPLASDDTVRAAVRDVLRAFGYKPTGRGKPASEYLQRAVGEGALSSINLAVDAGNAVSLHSGLPISVVDLGRARAPFRVAVAQAGASYVFNAAGQVIDVEGLPCLFDAEGPCANAVKDAQRTKTTADTRVTLSLVWGAKALGDRTARTVEWYRTLLERAGATTESA